MPPLLAWLPWSVALAATAGQPRLVRVETPTARSVGALIEAGLDVVEVRRGDHCLVLEWPGDGERLSRLGFVMSVVDEDPGRTAADRAREDRARHPAAPARRVTSAARADGVFRAEALPPYGSGSFAGYWSLEEIKMKLDALVDEDTEGVVADQVDTLAWSLQGRPIWGLRLGTSVSPPDERPVAFYNALTHAREPGGMQALLYFVDDLLGKYGADPMATYLLEHRVIYVVPVVNPDGYKLNQDFWSNLHTFSYHRKNLRDTNGNGVVDNGPDGVDLNRNYGHQWGLGGASTDPLDATYRGPGPFSEPESQAQRDAVNLLRPATGLSFHTWGDLMIHPWGWTEQGAPDSAAFHEWSDEMTQGVGYHAGQAPRILYPVSGEFTDWCYGETATKPRMFSWTPEVGGLTDGFWPPASRLVALGEENLRASWYVAAIAGPHVRVEDHAVAEGALNRGSIAHLSLRARNRGLNGVAGPGLTATLSSLSPGAHVIQGVAPLPSLGSFQSAGLLDGPSLVIAADDTVTLGRLLRFEVEFEAPGGYYSRDTIEVFCGTPTVLFADDAESGLGSWNTSTWGVQSGDPSHPGSFFADSPGGVYPLNTNNRRLTLGQSLDLSKATHAYLAFQARWEFETDFDCGLVEAKMTGNNWLALSGASTVPGRSGAQPVAEPVYEGARRLWRPELVDLSPVSGPGATAVNLRFGVLSDNAETFDGWNVDSVRVLAFDPAAQPAPVAVSDAPAPVALHLAAPVPNPARGPVRVAFGLARESAVRLEVLDLQGRRVRELAAGRFAAGRYQHGWDLRDERGWPVAPGLYLLRLATDETATTRRLAVVR